MNTDIRLYRHLPRHDSTAPSAVTIGNFDGVHRGHQAILAQVRERAGALGLVPTVMTFAPHPRAFFAHRGQRPELIPTQISSLRDKAGLLGEHGMRQIVIQRFDQHLADMGAEDFIRRLLVQGLNTRWLLVGEDFRYGHKRSGDIDLLRRMGREHGFEVRTLADVADSQGQRISSSALRTALAVGNLERSCELLGAPYRISGHVIHGRKLGRDLGFPTLNLRVPEPCAARSGIYVVRVHGLDEHPLPGVASLGVRPTVTRDGTLLLETHILDRRVDAYGKLVRVEFLEFLRDEESFPDLTTLTAAIRQDAQGARDYFASHGL
ncbi:bifunctional riboflavin kinase/FAD synthetase [Castellaniella defragrans]|uniref:Riboflavin biosynthesis protein n=2 Tax=Castellaniella defragrans TaxID=75697 RepID=W8X4C6_CASD6|nr:bifunctional riboflavin kinase/FAD synthetase [Castellaniella defragrans]KAB0602685.1 bifunctional riboflavin kinase/FAD synthetase [Castellaniella defragrans]MBB6082312.1 riboflavin kinase/FMN adenylyltransferase [Castellaniella defragrans]CDM24732.1 Riboflavin kinase / FMN adenylyltransferase [Castellaniella defragrans 65Phen]